MLAQHAGSRRVRGEAESLPFPDVSFDAAMAILTVHHWRDLLRGLRELKRVARRQVIFTWDPDHDRRLWIATEYVPAIIATEAARFATVPRIVEALDAHTVHRFEIPHDFTDGFQAAFWRNRRRTLIHESEQQARPWRRCRQNSLSLQNLSFVATSNQACGRASTAICWGWTAWITATESSWRADCVLRLRVPQNDAAGRRAHLGSQPDNCRLISAQVFLGVVTYVGASDRR